MITWRERQNCRTCKHAEAEELDRRYAQTYHGRRCLWPVGRLELPKMPISMNFRLSGKTLVDIGDPDCGANCQVWERWEAKTK